MTEQPKSNEQNAADLIAGLPVHDLSRPRADAILRKGVASLAFQRRYQSRPWLAQVDRLYMRYFEPAFVTGLAFGYISWALQWAYGPH